MDPIDPRWPKILSLSVHEFRTPMTVVAGYIRMLLKDRAGALNDQQRRLLEEAEKSCARLSALVAEVSDLSNLEGGTAPFNKSRTDLHAAIRAAVAQLPPLPDREVPVHVELDGDPAPVDGDPVRLTQALGSVVAALRRELVGDEGLTIRERQTANGYELLLGDSATIEALEAEPETGRGVFDEWRGGVGLSLAVARRILNAHGGSIYAPPGPPDQRKAGARIVIAKP
jgi:two-component system sensor histidine kinase BaeS